MARQRPSGVRKSFPGTQTSFSGVRKSSTGISKKFPWAENSCRRLPQGPLGLEKGPLRLEPDPLKGHLGLNMAHWVSKQASLGIESGPSGFGKRLTGDRTSSMGFGKGPLGLLKQPTGACKPSHWGFKKDPWDVRNGPQELTKRSTGARKMSTATRKSLSSVASRKRLALPGKNTQTSSALCAAPRRKVFTMSLLGLIPAGVLACSAHNVLEASVRKGCLAKLFGFTRFCLTTLRRSRAFRTSCPKKLLQFAMLCFSILRSSSLRACICTGSH